MNSYKGNNELNFNHLVLLIGTNPVPNYAAAEFFIQNHPNLKNIWLIYSEENRTINQSGTLEYAENLEHILKTRYSDRLNFPLNKVSISNVGDAATIERDIKEKLLEKLPEHSRVGLNYTGGTKVMGIHVYRGIEHSERVGEKSFSYLDSRNYQIINDNGMVLGNDLRKKIKISFDNLIGLHGFERKNKDSGVDFSEPVKIFKSLLENEGLGEYFNSKGGYQRELFENKKRPERLAKKIKELKEELKTYKAQQPFLSVVQKMPEGHRFFDKNGTFVEPISDRACKEAIRFLDGGWLEEYVYTTLKDNLSGCEVLKNWEIGGRNWVSNQRFELDVILMNGYQLIGLSCTTSEKRYLCKSKGFEIILRTRQIGGDEAKAVLVTRLKDSQVNGLQDELILDTGQTESNIMVLGDKDLKHGILLEKISEFIN